MTGKEIERAATHKRVGARLTTREALEQAVEVIEALSWALRAHASPYSYDGRAVEAVEAFSARLLEVAKEVPPCVAPGAR